MKTTNQIMRAAWKSGTVIPAFNIPHLPMMQPVIRALADTRTFGLITVARLEWIKFQARSLEAVCRLYQELKDEGVARLHLDHVPVVDEDGLEVDYEKVIGEALELGYQSVMVDGSRLPLEDNIRCTRRVVAMAHAVNVPVEAELGAVLGHEEGPLPPYEELFRTGRGFTDPEEARRFVEETGADWLSVAAGNIHGAVSKAARDKKKVAARLNIDRVRLLNDTVKRPLVLHGGSGIQKPYLMEAFANGVAKLNVGTLTRQVYERESRKSERAAQDAVYATVVELVREELEIGGSADRIAGGG